MLYADGVHLVHLGGTIIGHWNPDRFTDVLYALATANDGYWIFPFNEISLTHPDPPLLHGTGQAYWNALDQANSYLDPQ